MAKVLKKVTKNTGVPTPLEMKEEDVEVISTDELIQGPGTVSEEPEAPRPGSAVLAKLGVNEGDNKEVPKVNSYINAYGFRIIGGVN